MWFCLQSLAEPATEHSSKESGKAKIFKFSIVMDKTSSFTVHSPLLVGKLQFSFYLWFILRVYCVVKLTLVVPMDHNWIQIHTPCRFLVER